MKFSPTQIELRELDTVFLNQVLTLKSFRFSGDILYINNPSRDPYFLIEIINDKYMKVFNKFK